MPHPNPLRRPMPAALLLALLAALAWATPGTARCATYDEDEVSPWWLGVGFGSGWMLSHAPAPSAQRSGIAGSLDFGYRMSPQWGLGLELGVVAATSGCSGRGCSYAVPDFAPDFTHWFLVSELRPADGLRLRLGAGLSSMCYRYYEGPISTWQVVVDAVLFNNPADDFRTTVKCDHLHAFGVSAAVGYQWPLRAPGTSLGVQLRSELANYAASAKAGTPAFGYRGLALQLQFNIN